jgi:hypothetical protein
MHAATERILGLIEMAGGGVALGSLEVAAAEVPVSFHVANDTAVQLALDDPEDASLLTGDEDAVRIDRAVAELPLST